MSIVVPIYKIPEPLQRRCIESLLAQTLENLEILLVDDGCPAGGGAICEEYAKRDPRIRVIHRVNGGISAARNTGMDAARGEYIAFVDGDDFVEPDYCRKLYAAAEKSGADTVLCGADRFYPSQNTFSPHVSCPELVCEDAGALRQLRLSQLLCMKLRRNEVYLPGNGYVWARLYRTELLRGLRFDESMPGGEDRLFNFHVLKRCRVLCSIPDVMYHYVVNTRSLTHTFRPNARTLALETYCIYRALPDVEQDREFRNTYYIRTCCMVIALIRSYFFHPANPDKQNLQAFRAFCREDVVAEAIGHADIGDMRLCKMKLCILCLKAGRYKAAVRLAGRFRL